MDEKAILDRINDFIDRGRVKKVFVQADAPFRKSPADLGNFYVRGATNAMTPMSSFSTTDWTYGPARLERYNGVASFEIMGSPAPGVSSGTAIKAMEEMAGARIGVLSKFLPKELDQLDAELKDALAEHKPALIARLIRIREPGDDDDQPTSRAWLTEFNRLIGRPQIQETPL